MGLFFEIMVCALAVFGLWCAMRLLSESCFGSRRIRPSVTISNKEEMADIACLLGEARVLLSTRRGGRIVVLCDESLTEQGRIPCALACACRRYGAVCCVARLPSELRGNQKEKT